MQLSRDEALKLAKKGLFYVCATCPKWHEGKAKGLDQCTGVACGSPIRRKDFPEYSGDIKDFSRLCFACGSEDVLAFASIQNGERRFGLCKNHLEIVDDYVYKTESNLVVNDNKVLITPNPDRVMGDHRDKKVIL